MGSRLAALRGFAQVAGEEASSAIYTAEGRGVRGAGRHGVGRAVRGDASRGLEKTTDDEDQVPAFHVFPTEDLMRPRTTAPAVAA
ncbi:hypothetical protein ACFCZ6_09745 [Streptomyces hydrogenans]|uniref:hypothetical protein n=1 Tax=Streptomyces hydrogenans TaxID=1873719 RepID=UPI0035D8DDFB